MEYNEGTRTGSEENPGIREQVSGTISDVKEKVSEIKDKAADVGRRASSKIDAQRETAARTLESTAQRLQDRGESMSGVVSGTAEKLHSAADYLREHDVRAMVGDVEDVVRRHPGPALAAAAAVGFLVGRAFNSKD